jgi:hypothetical protein
MSCDDESRIGPIEGIRLPASVWEILRQENITTVSQLRAVLERGERTCPGVGPEMAQVIRVELASMAPAEVPSPEQDRVLSPWAA